ncbi:hypothetical protein [Labilibaculum sp. K2S]|uniref:hypothetical protein n=1 Tax=Labilibaculum sp. K2S TaxID=3056386 RepID=UPI0025A41549|nr:hypothetical protein [Labilibaculum sp. K2S]
MDYQNDFETNKEEIQAFPLKDVKLPDTPIDIVAADAETLQVEAIEDKEALVAAGLDWSKTENLRTRAGALRYCQAVWMSEYRARQEAQKEWLNLSPEAYNFRDEMLHHFSFAYRAYPDIKTKIARIRDGNGHADMIQDLIELAVLGEKYPEPLAVINFDVTLNQKARTTARTMSELLAASNGSKDDSSANKVIRDKAYTLLIEDMRIIREIGQYVFWRNPERKEKYVNTYKRG